MTDLAPVHAFLADLTAVVHLALVAFLVVGGVLACARPRLLRAHLAVLGGVAAFNLTGSDCPLTVLEQHLRALAGQPSYGGGFISHYLVEPVHPAGITPAVDVAIYALVLVPTLTAYTWLAVSRYRRRSDRPIAGQRRAPVPLG